MVRDTIFVAGFPKSGTTWLTRLMGDICNCPTGGFIEYDDKNEIATEGSDRPSPFIVRKGHYHPVFGIDDPIIGRDLGLNVKRLKNPRIVVITRDPRDIAVSASYYWSESLYEIVSQMTTGTGHFRAVGTWSEYIKNWKWSGTKISWIKFEDLICTPKSSLEMLLRSLRLLKFSKRVEEAYNRQSFENRVKHIVTTRDYYNQGQEFNLRFMRKGIMGDWKNHFDKRCGRIVNKGCWSTMYSLSFETDPEWWKCLP